MHADTKKGSEKSPQAGAEHREFATADSSPSDEPSIDHGHISPLYQHTAHAHSTISRDSTFHDFELEHEHDHDYVFGGKAGRHHSIASHGDDTRHDGDGDHHDEGPGDPAHRHEDSQISTSHPDATVLGASDTSLACPICTEDFQKGETLRVLPCNHRFHADCVDPWLVNVSGTCPLCRVDLNRTSQTEGSIQEDGTDAESVPADQQQQHLRAAQQLRNHRWSRSRSIGHRWSALLHSGVDERLAMLRGLRNHRRQEQQRRYQQHQQQREQEQRGQAPEQGQGLVQQRRSEEARAVHARVTQLAEMCGVPVPTSERGRDAGLPPARDPTLEELYAIEQYLLLMVPSDVRLPPPAPISASATSDAAAQAPLAPPPAAHMPPRPQSHGLGSGPSRTGTGEAGADERSRSAFRRIMTLKRFRGRSPR
ncbi:hypothetical protein KEM52_002613 [Ascosphaera acerosa]|nr:hypothetical protein KEM52_002613 [Ascosphaera acerosa]